jgi:multicomponent Na+:H+ antiporter subunit E
VTLRRSLPVWLALLTSTWLLWSGLYTPLLLGLGALSCAITLYLAHRMRLLDELNLLRVLLRLPAYWLWLAGEVVRSSLEVARIILDPRLPDSPTTVELKDLPEDTIGQAILGNSIILTPGTLTLDLQDNQLLAHSLTRSGADALATGEFSRRVKRLTNT